MIDVPRADNPLVFTNPSSLSFGDLNVTRGEARQALTVEVSDAGGGSGTWSVDVLPQSASAGASLEAPALVTLAPGRARLSSRSRRAPALRRRPATTTASSSCAAGLDTRRIPYAFFVTRPALQDVSPIRCADSRTAPQKAESRESTHTAGRRRRSDTRRASPGRRWSRTARSACTSSLISTGPSSTSGVSVVSASSGARDRPVAPRLARRERRAGPGRHPGRRQSADVRLRARDRLGSDGLPATQALLRLGRLGAGRLHGQAAPRQLSPALLGQRPPPAEDRLLTRRVAAGRPTLAVRVQDSGSGVDPYSLLIAYGASVIGGDRIRPSSGVGVFVLPSSAPRLRRGSTRAIFGASDFQEAKNITTFGPNVMPNTSYRGARIRAVRGHDGDMASAEAPRLRARQPGAARRREHDRPHQGGALPRRAQDDQDRHEGRLGDLQRHLANASGATWAAQASCRRRVGSRPRRARLAHRAPVQVAVVTGGATGIGAAVARRLAGRGWRCVLVGRREDRLQATGRRRSTGSTRSATWATARRSSRWRRRCGSAIPKVGLLVNNAGVPGRGNFLDIAPEKIEELIRTNYLGSVWCLLGFLPALEAAAPAHLVNVVSVAGTVAIGPYSASKHAQLALLAVGGPGATPARRARAHRQPRLRAHGGLPSGLAHAGPVRPRRGRPRLRRGPDRARDRARPRRRSSSRAGTARPRLPRRLPRGPSGASAPAARRPPRSVQPTSSPLPILIGKCARVCHGIVTTSRSAGRGVRFVARAGRARAPPRASRSSRRRAPRRSARADGRSPGPAAGRARLRGGAVRPARARARLRPRRLELRRADEGERIERPRLGRPAEAVDRPRASRPRAALRAEQRSRVALRLVRDREAGAAHRRRPRRDGTPGGRRARAGRGRRSNPRAAPAARGRLRRR